MSDTAKRSERLLRGGGIISAGTMTTRLLGLLRELMTAAYFGAGGAVDAFVVAFSVPGLFRRVLGEEMFERAFMPPFRRMADSGEGGHARAFLARIFLLVVLALVLVSALVYLLLPRLVHLLAPGMDAKSSEEALSLARMILPFLFLVGISAFSGSVLQFSRKLLLFSMAPALSNLIIILTLFFLHERLSIRALVLGWLLGAAGAILIQAPAALKIYQGLEKASVEAPHPPVAPAIREGGHVFFASAVSKSVEIVDRVFASLIGTGAISSLYFSFRLVHLPFSVLSLALSRSLAPEFSRLRGQEDTDGFAGLVHFGIGINLIVLTPIVLFLMVFSAEVVGLFYGRGAFGSGAISRTSWAYLFYAPAILPMGLIALLNRVHASLEDNRLPLLAAVVGAVLNIGLDALLWNTPLQQGGIALASSLGLSVQTLVLLFRLGPASRGMLKKTGILLLRLLVPLLILAAILLSLRNLMGPGTSFTGRLWRLALGVLAGAFLYVPPAWRLRPSMEHTRPETPLS